ncbi:MAG: DUF4214 domain-containing protein, partial [Pyrinomonadaceae bacterium]
MQYQNDFSKLITSSRARSCGSLTATCLSIALTVVLLSVSQSVCAQNIRHTQNVQDLGIRSELLVEPTSLGLNIQIPFRQYPGRGGTSLSPTLFWSSKVWRIAYQGNYPEPLPYGGELLHTIVQGKYAEHSISGWTTGLDLPWYEFTGGDQYYGDYGQSIPEPTEFPPNWQYQVHYVRRMLVHMPDGSSYELRSSDQIFNGIGINSGVYYAVDGSRIKYDPNSGLHLPDGSRYVYPGQGIVRYIDRNGNTLTYSASTRQWTDTIGRTIGMPPMDNSAPGDRIYSLPGLSGTTLNYTFRWKNLADARTDPNQPLRYVGDYGGHTPSLFVSIPNPDQPAALDYVDGSSIFNPVVLSEIILPTGTSYKFSYNVWGEVDKIIYPMGGYERYRYDEVAALTQLDGVYAQGNRGVVERWISPSGTGADEIQWQYTPGSTTSPDGTVTTRSVHRSNVNAAYGFQDAKAGLPYDERVYSSTGQMLRRKLTEYAVSGPAPGGYGAATRNPRVTREVEIILDTGGSALAKTRTYGYDLTYQFDVGFDRTSVIEYDYVPVDQALAQTGTITSIPNGPLVRTTATTYLTADANYRNRNILGLPTSTTVYNASDTMVAQSTVSYDESSYPLYNYGAITGWTDPASTIRGNPTTARKWVDIGNTWLESHAQYDQCGSPMNSWDLKGNLSQVSYSPNYAYAYPTQSTSAVPDPTNTYGTNTSLVTTSTYDFSTGLVISMADANGMITTLEYNDPLNRLTRVNQPDGGRTTYNYVDAHQCGAYVETKTLLDSSPERWTDSWQFFDGLGRAYLAESLDGQDPSNPYLRVDMKYDAMGRAWKVSSPYRSSSCTAAINPSGRWTETTFDALGRPKQITTPDSAVVTTDYSGNTVTVTDQAGKKRRSVTDGLGRLARVDEPDSNGNLGLTSAPAQPTNYTYDALGNLRKVDQGSQQRFFMYDSLSRLIRAKNPEQAAGSLASNMTDAITGNTQWSMAYGYDNNGNLTARVDARNITTNYAYDALNRNYSTTYSDGTVSTYRYYDLASNGRGRLYWDQAAGVSANVFDAYDGMGRPTQYRQRFWVNGAWGQSFNITRTYDKAGHVITQTNPSGHTVIYNYDAAGRLGDKDASNLAFSGNLGDGVTRTYATGISYSEFGGLQQEQFGTQTPLYHKLHYNVRGQLYDIRLSTVAWAADQWNWNRGALLNWYDSTSGFPRQNPNSAPDNNGNVTRQEIWIPSDDQITGYNWMQQNYSYDSLNRLASATELQNGSSTSYTQGYDYDRWGNRTINPSSSISNVQFDKADAQFTNRLYAPGDTAIQTMNQRRMQYDEAGNQIYDSYSGQGQRTYDAENRMKQAWANNQWQTYTYDADGHRIKRNVNGVETWQVYGMDGELLSEYEAGAAPFLAVKDYGYRNGELLVTVTSGDVQRLKRFVKNLYFNIFAREATAAELQQEMDTLGQAGVQGEAQLLTTARSIARGLFQSSEYSARGRTDSQYVTDLYNSYLQRGPDTPGLNYWVSNTQANGRGATLNAFEVCTEFATLA